MYDIWQYYGDSVTTAAGNCGLDATPVPASAANTTADANSTVTSPSSQPTLPTSTVTSQSASTSQAATTQDLSSSAAESGPGPSETESVVSHSRSNRKLALLETDTLYLDINSYWHLGCIVRDVDRHRNPKWMERMERMERSTGAGVGRNAVCGLAVSQIYLALVPLNRVIEDHCTPWLDP